MKTQLHILVIFLFGISISSMAQISHGGKPLPFLKNTLRASNKELFVEMPAFDNEKALRASTEANQKFKSLHFAHKFFVHLRPDNSGVQFTTVDGTRVWRVGIRSKNAYSLNILFSKFHLPKGAKLFVYNTEQTEILGAYTDENNSDRNLLPIQPIAGESIIVEYQEPENAIFKGAIEVGEVNHDFRGLFRSTEPRDPTQTCHPNVICYPEDAKPSSSVIELIINGNTYCTGSLVNNTSEDNTPYVLTATHCLNNDYSSSFLRNRHYDVIAGSIVAFFDYQSPVCGANTTENIRGPLQMTMTSMDSVYISEKHDISLLRFKEMPPREYQPFLSGWDATASPTPVFHGIHHPNGGIKKVGIDENELKIGSFSDPRFGMSPNSHWIVTSWETGNTEAGSSGSPLYDFEKRVVGTLTGGESMCSSPRGKDIYAALYKAWETTQNMVDPQPTQGNSIPLKSYLDPENSGVLQMNGMNPYENKPMTKIHNYGKAEEVNQALFNNTPLFSTNNSLGYSEFAEVFHFKENTQIAGIFITSAPTSSISEMDVKIKIYKGNDHPEELVYETDYYFAFQYSISNGFAYDNRNMRYKLENYIRFDKPVSVSGKCFIAYSDAYAVSQGFTVLNVKPREIGAGVLSTAWMKNSAGWVASSENIDYPMNTSLLISPYIIGDTSLIINPKEDDFELKVFHNNALKKIFIVANRELLAWELFNVSGQKIDAAEIDKSIHRVAYSSSKLANGVYVVKVNTSSGMQVRKILVN